MLLINGDAESEQRAECVFIKTEIQTKKVLIEDKLFGSECSFISSSFYTMSVVLLTEFAICSSGRQNI